MTLDVRTIYMMNAVMYLMLHGIIWVSLSRYKTTLVRQWSLGGIVSAAGVAFLGSDGWLPEWAMAVFGQLLMALGNFGRQYALRTITGQPSRRWVMGLGLFNLVYLGLNGTLFFTGASRTLMMEVFFGFYVIVCFEYALVGRAIRRRSDSTGARSVQWSGWILSGTLAVKCLSVWMGWGAQDLYDPGWDQNVMFAGQFLAISLMNFGFMQILVDEFQGLRQRAEQNAQALAQALLEREDILRQLTLSNKSAGMGALASSMAHEINQPLTTIVLKSELIDSHLAEAGSEPQVRNLLAQIRQDTHRAGAMIRTLRSMFNSDKGHFEQLDFAGLLREMAGMVHSHAQRQNIALEVDAPETLQLIGDATQLQQVVLNLLNNAIHSFAGANVKSPCISVQCRQEGAALELRVQDNGCGIDPAVWDDVFALFKPPRSRGMGVGLWLSQSVVQNHGGTLEFFSTPGEGSVFVLRLPVHANGMLP